MAKRKSRGDAAASNDTPASETAISAPGAAQGALPDAVESTSEERSGQSLDGLPPRRGVSPSGYTNSVQRRNPAASSPKPFGLSTMVTANNAVTYGASYKDKTNCIRFARDPSEGFPQGKTHPAQQLIENAGYERQPSEEGSFTWSRAWAGPEFDWREDRDGRALVEKAANLLGGRINPTRSR